MLYLIPEKDESSESSELIYDQHKSQAPKAKTLFWFY